MDKYPEDQPWLYETGQPGDERSLPPSILPEVLKRLNLSDGPRLPMEARLKRLFADLAHEEWVIRARALRELGRLSVSIPSASLETLLSDSQAVVRANTVWALAQLGPQAPLEILLRMVHDSDWQVRESAIQGLRVLGTGVPARVLLEALKDPDSAVRAAARGALQQTYPGLVLNQIEEQRTVPRDVASRPAALNLWLANIFGRLRMLLATGTQTQAKIKEGKNMQDAQYTPGTTSSRYPGKVPAPKRPLWRIVGVSAIVAVLLVNVAAWLILSHSGSAATQTGQGSITTATPSNQVRATPTTAVDPKRGKTLYTYTDPQEVGNLISVDWSHNGRQLAASGLNVKAFDALTGKHIISYGNNDLGASTWVTWSPDGKRLAASSGSVQIIDASTKAILATFQPAIQNAGIQGNGGNPMAVLSGGNMILASSWSPDGKLVASAVDGNAVGFNVQIWNSHTGQHIRTLAPQFSPNANTYIESVAWSPDGKYVAAAGLDRYVWVWNASTGASVARIDAQSPSVGGISWSPDSKDLALGSGSQVRVWSIATRAFVFSYQAQGAQPGVSVVAWSPNGRYIAAGGSNVTLWDVAAGKIVYTYRGHGQIPNGGIRDLSWSPDSKKIASLADGMQITAPHTGNAINNIKVWIAA